MSAPVILCFTNLFEMETFTNFIKHLITCKAQKPLKEALFVEKYNKYVDKYNSSLSEVYVSCY